MNSPVETPTPFTWHKFNDQWCVCGPLGYSKEMVEVRRKSGRTVLVRLGRVAHSDPTTCRAFYHARRVP